MVTKLLHLLNPKLRERRDLRERAPLEAVEAKPEEAEAKPEVDKEDSTRTIPTPLKIDQPESITKNLKNAKEVKEDSMTSPQEVLPEALLEEDLEVVSEEVEVATLEMTLNINQQEEVVKDFMNLTTK